MYLRVCARRTGRRGTGWEGRQCGQVLSHNIWDQFQFVIKTSASRGQGGCLPSSGVQASEIDVGELFNSEPEETQEQVNSSQSCHLQLPPEVH